ncbi:MULTISPECIES: cytochrome P450 [unclassified Streptomyces]|uniref:cytochrome P450 family protein n=1 Tax=unclassified Streptomyces TaxID=2593676 RepID=UPI000DBAC569|nr:MULTISPECIES: cytochrome P450 [unclassified Streptomyces]MYT71691.1 cytochrome P450 [Streptomyces sp. SID8367]RAJ72941.1 cytochrome P450 [Streptomyces sp. PsTaAH-137]
MTEIVDLNEYSEYADGGRAGFYADPYPVYEKLRARGPVHHVRTPGPGPAEELWLIVGHDAARAAFTDPRLAKTPPWDMADDLIGPHLLFADPPEHGRLRSLVTREFTPGRVAALAPRIQKITDELLDDMVPRGSADLIAALAFPLPFVVICELLGVLDIDRDRFRRMSTQVVAPTSDEEAYAAHVEIAGFLDELIEDKRCAAPADDLLSALIRTTAEDGDRLSPAELRGMAFLLLVAGHETTVNLIGNGVRALLDHPDQLAALRADMSLLDGAVEEMLRYDGPVETATHRFAAEPVEIGGTVIPAGDPVLIAIGDADRDPARFPAPDRFDIRRAPRGHLAFGHGIHYCLGAPLARLEGRIALRSLLERCPDLSLDGTPDTWLPGLLMRGVRTLRVRW